MESLKASRYNFWVSIGEDEYVLFNGVSGALISLTWDESKTVQAAMREAGKSLLPKVREALVAGRFLVPSALDEVEWLMRRANVEMNHQSVLDIEICPTYACNFRCRYCYIDFQDPRMDIDAEGRVSKFLDQQLSQYRACRLTWSGGEPLLCIETVLRLSSHASRVAKRQECRLDTTLLTNGYLLDSGAARDLWAAGIHRFHVTIDGTEEFHDRVRPLSNGAPTWRRVLDNVLGVIETLPDLRLNLRINVSKGNGESIPTLLDEIPAEFRKRIQVDISPVASRSTKCGMVDRRLLAREPTIHRLSKEALHRGYRLAGSQIPNPTAIHCVAECRGNFQVGPDGSLYKCNPREKPEAVVGRIDDLGNAILNQAFSQWHDNQGPDRRCQECQYLCFCASGCPVGRLRKQVDPNCTVVYENIDSMITTLYHRRRSEMKMASE